MPVIPEWKRPERTSFPTVLLGNVYVAAPKPDGPGYVLRKYTPDAEPEPAEVEA